MDNEQSRMEMQKKIDSEVEKCNRMGVLVPPTFGFFTPSFAEQMKNFPQKK